MFITYNKTDKKNKKNILFIKEKLEKELFKINFCKRNNKSLWEINNLLKDYTFSEIANNLINKKSCLKNDINNFCILGNVKGKIIDL